MKTNWDLTVFYKDFDDPEFKDDLARLPKEIDAFTAAIAAPAEDEVEKLVSLVHQEEALSNLFERLSLMIGLTLSVDANNKAANAAMAPLMRAVMGSRWHPTPSPAIWLLLRISTRSLTPTTN